MSTLTSKTRNWFWKALIQLLVFCLCVPLADFSLWVFAPVYLDNAAVEVVQHQDLPGIKKTVVYRDQSDVRSLTPVITPKPKNLIRVLCLGASTTQQITQETEDTWCGILQKELQDRYGRASGQQFQTIGHGGGGARAFDSALWLRNHFDEFEPDFVITLLGINDLTWGGGPGYQKRDVERELKQIDSEILRSKCKAYSQICRRITQIKRNLARKNQIATGAAVEWHTANIPNLRKARQRRPYVENPQRNPDPINEFRDAVAWLKTFSESRNVPLLLLAQPVLWKPSMLDEEVNALWFPISTPAGEVRTSGSWLYKEMQSYNRVQESFANGTSVRYVDLDREVPKSLEYYFDDCHYTDAGSRRLAQAVLPELLKMIAKSPEKNTLRRAGSWL